MLCLDPSNFTTPQPLPSTVTSIHVPNHPFQAMSMCVPHSVHKQLLCTCASRMVTFVWFMNPMHQLLRDPENLNPNPCLSPLTLTFTSGTDHISKSRRRNNRCEGASDLCGEANCVWGQLCDGEPYCASHQSRVQQCTSGMQCRHACVFLQYTTVNQQCIRESPTHGRTTR